MTEGKRVRVGEAFAISLPANPTTGYDWQVEISSGSVVLLRRDHHRSADRIGAGGTTTFTFQATAPGEAVLRFRYLRPWEGPAVEERVVPILVSA